MPRHFCQHKWRKPSEIRRVTKKLHLFRFHHQFQIDLQKGFTKDTWYMIHSAALPFPLFLVLMVSLQKAWWKPISWRGPGPSGKPVSWISTSLEYPGGHSVPQGKPRWTHYGWRYSPLPSWWCGLQGPSRCGSPGSVGPTGRPLVYLSYSGRISWLPHGGPGSSCRVPSSVGQSRLCPDR